MAFSKALFKLCMLYCLTLVAHLQLLGVGCTEIYMKNPMTSATNFTNELITIHSPIHHQRSPHKSNYIINVSVDTGGSASWIPCDNHAIPNHARSLSDPLASSSYEYILGNSPLCLPFSTSSWLPSCNFDDPMPCNFSRTCVAGATPIGVLTQDILAFSMHEIQLPKIAFGCAYEGRDGVHLPNNWMSGNIGPKSITDIIFHSSYSTSVQQHYVILSYWWHLWWRY